MAVILVLVCGFLGFTSAVAAFFLFDVSLMQALALWMIGGLAAVALAILPAVFPRRALAEDRQPEIA